MQKCTEFRLMSILALDGDPPPDIYFEGLANAGMRRTAAIKHENFCWVNSSVTLNYIDIRNDKFDFKSVCPYT